MVTSNKPSFFAELKRRNVLRAGVLYIGAVWAISQGVSQLSGPFGLANWVTIWFVIACAIGFPFWLAFAWFYAWTPHGFKREEDVEHDPARAHSAGRKLDFAIIGVLALAVVLLASGYFVRRKAPATLAVAEPAATAPKPFNPPADTLLVLPFVNLSNDPKQQYFSDGITEELTNALGQTTGLRVIAWDTASRYRDSRQPATDIGKALDVANVLTGKILRQGDEVRVIVELVDVRSGYQVWADHYDDLLAHVFQVQDQISGAIAGALKVKFASLRAPPTVDPAAHDLVLRARALMEKARTAAPIEQARALYEQAVAIDPGYADAHAGLAGAWLELTAYTTLSMKDVLPQARVETQRALALDPNNVEALVQLGIVLAAEGRTAEAKAQFERALAIDPSDAEAHLDYGLWLPLKQALAQDREAAQLDPDNANAQNDLAVAELDVGETSQALAPGLALIRLDPHSADSAFQLALTYALLHRDADAAKAFDLAQPATPLSKSLIAAGRLTYHSLLVPDLRAQALAAVDGLRRWPALDPESTADVLQLELALGQDNAVLEQLPKFCASLAVACSDLGINPFWLPLRGQPRFEVLVKQYDTLSRPAPDASARL